MGCGNLAESQGEIVTKMKTFLSVWQNLKPLKHFDLHLHDKNDNSTVLFKMCPCCSVSQPFRVDSKTTWEKSAALKKAKKELQNWYKYAP